MKRTAYWNTYNKRNRNKKRVNSRTWYKNHKEHASILHREYYGKHKERIMNKLRRLRIAAVMALGGSCVRCGETDLRVLQINHILESGVIGRRRVGQNAKTKMYTDILSGNAEGRFDVRCANCNIIYEYERGRIRPHE